jgi:RNA polymerase sigma factor (sigma-70 family)
MPFDLLIRRIGPTLKRITRKLNGHHSFFDDDDLYQEALTHLWVSFRQGSIEDKTDSYILQGCYYHLRNYLRTVQEHATFVSLNNPIGDDSVTLEESLSAEEMGLLDYVVGKLDVEALEEQCLTAREKTILDLFLEGMSMREIGSRLGISHMMVWKIRNKIKEKYIRFNTPLARES